MKKTLKIALEKRTMTTISEVLKNNLFTLTEDAWGYADDSGQLAMSITYTIEGDEVELDVWMLDEEMQLLLDKVMDEIKEGR